MTILSEEWLPDSEELTPTSKLKRKGIHAKYADRDRGALRLTTGQPARGGVS